MKKLSIAILAVVMAVSMAVPAVAGADGGIELSASGDGTAEWSTAEFHSPDYSAKLYVLDGGADWAEVSIPVDIAIEAIYELKFWEMIDLLGASGWDVNVILGVDCDGDGVFGADVIDWHIGSGQHTAAALAGDSFVEMDGWGGLTDGTFGAPVTYAGLSGDVGWTEVDIATVEYGWWTVKADGTGFAYFGMMAGGSFTDYLAWLDGSTDDGLIDKGMHVKVVKLVIGGSGLWVDEIAYVDDLTLNGVTYDFDGDATVTVNADIPVVVSILVDPTTWNFGTVFPGDSSALIPVTVTNTGSVPIRVTTELRPTGNVFYNCLHFPASGDLIRTFAYNLDGGDNYQAYAQLQVPRDYTATGTETATIIFWATPLP